MSDLDKSQQVHQLAAWAESSDRDSERQLRLISISVHEPPNTFQYGRQFSVDIPVLDESPSPRQRYQFSTRPASQGLCKKHEKSDGDRRTLVPVRVRHNFTKSCSGLKKPVRVFNFEKRQLLRDGGN
jgi:hypothetical protein